MLAAAAATAAAAAAAAAVAVAAGAGATGAAHLLSYVHIETTSRSFFRSVGVGGGGVLQTALSVISQHRIYSLAVDLSTFHCCLIPQYMNMVQSRSQVGVYAENKNKRNLFIIFIFQFFPRRNRTRCVTAVISAVYIKPSFLVLIDIQHIHPLSVPFFSCCQRYYVNSVVTKNEEEIYVFPGASNETYAPGTDLAHRRLTPDFTFICFWWRHELRQL